MIDGKLMTQPVRFVAPSTGQVYYYELAPLQAWAAVREAFTPDSVQRDGELDSQLLSFLTAAGAAKSEQGGG
ncbi:unnamed protein product [Amoebophrya sp. A25]|nr:unnamed protein product [Amoebophrya sp. A25]|eukprot:GSA25T00015813001.1